jgi:hypothetical protein
VAELHHSDVWRTALETLPKLSSGGESSDRARIAARRFRRFATMLASFALFCVTASVCQAQTHEALCIAGDGSFESAFHTGVKVRVGAARNGELATRACEAALSWDGQTRVIAANALRVDVDAFGVDLDAGVPVVTIQVQKSDAECCMSYQIYSLQKPPQLLRTITGGAFFSAADTDLDGRVEIWTDDSASVDGFENLDVRQLNAAPKIVLRFAKGRLLDVSSEFQPYFDGEIARVRAELDSQELRDFKNSDGILLPAAPASPGGPRRGGYLQGIKLKVLEIVWSYVYSGREQEAWHSLADMWPAADVERIRAAILKARAGGIGAQLDGVSTEVPSGRKEHATIFDGISAPPDGASPGVLTGQRVRGMVLPGIGSSETAKPAPPLVPPEPIELWLPRSIDASQQGLLDLVIDSAGKVRSVEPAGDTKPADAGLTEATAQWKFIPAFKAGRAVASRVRMSVLPKR